MLGNLVRPKTSTGTEPCKLARSSSTHWVKRERLRSESVRPERQQVKELGNAGELGAPEDFHRHRALQACEIELYALGKARKIGDHQDLFVTELTDECQHLAVAGIEKLQAAAAEGAKLLALLNETLHPPQQGMRTVLLGLDVDGL